MDFDTKNLSSIVFSIKTEGEESKEGVIEELYKTSTDKKVKKLLVGCLETTLQKFPDPIEDIHYFELSEKYSDKDRFQTHIDEYPRAADVFNEEPSENVFLADVPKDKIQYYRVDYTDVHGNKVSGVRRASYFKSLLKNKNRLVQFVDDSLRAVEDEFFKLDNDFDFLCYGSSVYVLRPRVFESMVLPDDVVTRTALERIDTLRETLDFVNFDSIDEVVRQYKRAARLVFAVSQRPDIQDTDKSKVVYYAGNSNVEIEVDEDGVVNPAEGHEIDFLEMLDRRIYNVEFIEGETESYKAYSRKRR